MTSKTQRDDVIDLMREVASLRKIAEVAWAIRKNTQEPYPDYCERVTLGRNLNGLLDAYYASKEEADAKAT